MILTALLALAAAAQEPAPPAPGVDRSDYHFRYLYRLDPREGWKRTISGIRYRRIGPATTGPRPAPTDTVTIHYAGRFTDGTTNATLPKSVAPEQLTLEEAAQLIDERAAKGPAPKKGRGRKAPAKKKAAKK